MCVCSIYYYASLKEWYIIIIMASKDRKVDKQSFMLCVPPTHVFIRGRDTHSLCVACLGTEHARSALKGADCPYCVHDVDAAFPESALQGGRSL